MKVRIVVEFDLDLSKTKCDSKSDVEGFLYAAIHHHGLRKIEPTTEQGFQVTYQLDDQQPFKMYDGD